MPGEQHDDALDELQRDFAEHGLMPLWTQRRDLMTAEPAPTARPHVWKWRDVLPIAERSGALVKVGRGGERRAIAFANPGLPGMPYATPTLWAAVQYLGPHETAPSHRHSQSAFRFVIDGEGVWTTVDGDPVAMRRGDLLLTPAMHFHEHRNTSDHAMAWLDGLDIPLVRQLDAGFFENGPDTVSERIAAASRSERLWGHPGLQPASLADSAPANASPLMAYRWQHTDAALRAQLELDDEGEIGVVSAGHAAVRFTDPRSGADCLPTIRCEMHRIRSGARTHVVRTVGSAVWQVFAGSGQVRLADQSIGVEVGDVVAVPSNVAIGFAAETDLDLFRFSDEPVYEALGLLRRTSTADGPDTR